jgi:hypothetical protein
VISSFGWSSLLQTSYFPIPCWILWSKSNPARNQKWCPKSQVNLNYFEQASMDWVLEHSTELASLSSRVLHRTTGDCTIFAFLGMYGSSDTLFVLVSFLSTRQSGVESFFMWNVRWSCFISSIALNQLSGAFPAYCLVFSFFFPVCGLCHVEPFFPYLCFSLSWVISILFWGVFFVRFGI